MERHVCRAAGTQTFSELIRNPKRMLELLTGDTSARAEADLAAWNAGEARAVAAFSRDDGRFRQGMPILDPAAPAPAVWLRFRALRRPGEGVVLAAPFHVHGVRPVDGPGSHTIDRLRFRLVAVQGADRHWELAVPTVDVPLVRAALHAIGSGP
ncbi:hypothetical protein [Embleya sp. NPDC020886]|uniref:hypothetical protein n=1 Tax=Embleya sp. NPDC020886 TaxID=3363980 RepID=UPI0037AE272C